MNVTRDGSQMGRGKNESPKRLPSRGGRIGETSIRKAKNSSNTGLGPQTNGTIGGASTEDYVPATAPINKLKAATFYNGRTITKEELTKDFAELESNLKNLRSAGSKVMNEIRSTRRFASKTSGPWHMHLHSDNRPPCAGHFHDASHGQSYTYMPNQKMLKIL
jgi:hypothetical protein